LLLQGEGRVSKPKRPEGDKFCQSHLQPEYFPITYLHCPYCGNELELAPELEEIRKTRLGLDNQSGGEVK